MIEIKNVFCPVDFSTCSAHALDHAGAIARWYQAKLTLLYVFPNLPAVDLPPIVLSDQERERLSSDLKEFARRVQGVDIDVHVREAPDVHSEINAMAEHCHADLLVLGSHGRSGLNRLLLGSVTERVIRKPPCPTMVVPEAAAGHDPSQPVRFQRILCPVDFSAPSTRALAYATALAEEADARLLALHVIEIPPEWRERSVAAHVNVDQVRAAAEAASLRRLRAMIPEEARTYCTVETAVEEGAAYKQILKVAQDRTIDLIVMGTHGHGMLNAMLSGSTTARVVRAATCPVIVGAPPE
ncbi:MAG TPA: universal stress protein [Vicinamibacterales bacterium]|nr:universal stress protein [Vicinamibacterales bacterium]